MRIRNFGLVFTILFGYSFLILSCKEKNNENSPAKLEKSEVYKMDDSFGSADSQFDTLKVVFHLENKIHTVFAQKSGRIIKSELNTFSPQALDSSVLIAAIDNRKEFIELRRLKIRLIDDLNSQHIHVKEDSVDFLNFKTSLRVDNLLPELNSNRFSPSFINWFQQQSFYPLFENIRAYEAGMDQYFYINHQPVYLNKVYLRKGQVIQKGEKLYNYVEKTKYMTFSTDCPINNSADIVEIYKADENSFKLNYELKGNKIYVSDYNWNHFSTSWNAIIIIKKLLS